MLENFEILLMFYLHTILHANVNLGRALKPFLNKVDKFENNKTKLKKSFPSNFLPRKLIFSSFLRRKHDSLIKLSELL